MSMEIKKKAAAVGLAATLGTTVLTGCGQDVYHFTLSDQGGSITDNGKVKEIVLDNSQVENYTVDDLCNDVVYGQPNGEVIDDNFKINSRKYKIISGNNGVSLVCNDYENTLSKYRKVYLAGCSDIYNHVFNIGKSDSKKMIVFSKDRYINGVYADLDGYELVCFEGADEFTYDAKSKNCTLVYGDKSYEVTLYDLYYSANENADLATEVYVTSDDGTEMFKLNVKDLFYKDNINANKDDVKESIISSLVPISNDEKTR